MPDPISWGAALPSYITWLLVGYLLGSIPFGLVLTRLTGKGDIRKIGSGNIGATNVLRTGDEKLAAATLLLDAFKGTIVVLIAFRMAGPDAAVCAGLGAFLGHLFPIWLKFKGGKGVATYLGLLLAFSWPTLIAAALIWLACAFITRYSSLSALIATLTTPFVLRFMELYQYSELFAVLTLLCWIKHHENIRRLLTGKESKIGQK